MNFSGKLILITLVSLTIGFVVTTLINVQLHLASASSIIMVLESTAISLFIMFVLVYRFILSEINKGIKVLSDKIIHSKNLLKEKATQSWEEEARFAASIQSLPIGFIMTNASGDIISANDASQRILNGQQEGQDIFTMKINETLNLTNAIKLALNSMSSKKYPSIAYNDKFIDVTITPIIVENKANSVIGSVTLLQDITESEIAERSKDEFFSIASHELRTPLTAIRSNTAIIRDYYKDKIDPDIKEIFEDIHEATVRLIKIVNDFLNTSRLELGRMQFKKEPVEVNSLIKDSLKEVQSLAQEKNISLNFTESSTPLNAIADRDKAKEIILNLVSNAIKYTEKGSVEIKVEKTDNKQIKFSILDTGRGIPMQNHNLLFRKFQQASDNILTRDSTQSSGLGLYISKLMTEGMEGTMYLESSIEGKGSTFVFTLPAESI